MTIEFTDSIDDNVNTIAELIAGLPPGAQQIAKRAAMKVESSFNDIRRDDPKNPAVALGVAWAVHVLAQRLVESVKSGEEKQLIQLLS